MKRDALVAAWVRGEVRVRRVEPRLMQVGPRKQKFRVVLLTNGSYVTIPVP